MSRKSLANQILRYKLIYSITGMALGLFTLISGFHLLALDIDQLSLTSWEVKLFGDGISVNDDNIAPGIALFLVGLFVMIVTQHRIKIDREDEQEMLESRALRYKFILSMTVLILGLLIMICIIVLFVNEFDGPADWARNFLRSYFNQLLGEVLFLIGLLMITTSRLMTKIYFSKT